MAGPVALRLDPASMLLDETPHERQAESQPSLASIQRAWPLDEGLEEPGNELLSQTLAIILDHEPDAAIVFSGLEPEVSARRRVLRRIREQVGDHLRQPIGIPQHRKAGSGHVRFEHVPPPLDERGRRLHRPGDHGGELERLAVE